MIEILEITSIVLMFLVGALFPLGMLIYLVVIFIKDEIEINRLIKKSGQKTKALNTCRKQKLIKRVKNDSKRVIWC